MRCPRYGSNWLPKYDHSRSQQTYRCGHCHYHFVPGTEHPHQPEQLKAQAAAMYTEGSDMAASSRIPGSKEETVYSWVKKVGQARELLRRGKSSSPVSLCPELSPLMSCGRTRKPGGGGNAGRSGSGRQWQRRPMVSGGWTLSRRDCSEAPLLR